MTSPSARRRALEAPLSSAALLKDVMAGHFAAVDRAARERTAPVAWCTSVGPVELLRALGYEVFFPENHGALLGASRLAAETMPRAHALGYSPDICSYLTSDIGAYLAKRTPLARHGLSAPPRPDLLLYSTNQCREVRDWFEFYGREWSVPVVGVTSFRDLGELEPHHVDAVARQLEALVPALEAVAGRRLDAGAAGGGGGALAGVQPWPGATAWPPPRRARRRSPSSTRPSRWARRWCCAAPRRRSTTTGTCWPSCGSGWRAAPGPSRASASGCTGTACRSGGGCETWPRSSVSSRPAWSPPPTATAGSSRRSTRAIRSRPWRGPPSSSSSRAPRGPSSATWSG